jgi:hypothetical protein
MRKMCPAYSRDAWSYSAQHTERWFCTQRFPVDSLVTLHYKVNMKAINRIVAITELLLVLPGMLFMTALFVRNIQPEPYEPAHTARRVVDWYSSHPPFGLHVFLVALPFAAFIIGCALVARRWRTDADLRLIALHTLAVIRSQWTVVLVAAATLIAGGILVIVALHMITE